VNRGRRSDGNDNRCRLPQNSRIGGRCAAEHPSLPPSRHRAGCRVRCGTAERAFQAPPAKRYSRMPRKVK
jgi:hypothetical protein